MSDIPRCLEIEACDDLTALREWYKVQKAEDDAELAEYEALTGTIARLKAELEAARSERNDCRYGPAHIPKSRIISDRIGELVCRTLI